MPRYNYFCTYCESEFMTAHGMNEVKQECDLCNMTGSINKILSKPIMISNKTKTNNKKVGELTSEFIEKNRELLKSMKNDKT